MTITIRINTGNATFHDENADEQDRAAQDVAREFEVNRILSAWLGVSAERGMLESTNLRDYHGNTVGSVTVRGK